MTRARPQSELGRELDQADADATREYDALSGVSKATLFAAVGIVFLMLRVFTVAGWDWETAWAITSVVDFGDIIAIVAGTFFARPALTGVLFAAVIPLLVIRLFWHMHGVARRPVTTGMLLAVIGSWYASLLVASGEWWTLLSAAVVSVVVVGMRLIWSRGTFAHALVKFLLTRAGVLASAACLVLAVLVPEPWVQRETIVAEHETVTGYVLGVDDAFIQVLTDERRMQAVPSAGVISRTPAG